MGELRSRRGEPLRPGVPGSVGDGCGPRSASLEGELKERGAVHDVERRLCRLQTGGATPESCRFVQ